MEVDETASSSLHSLQRVIFFGSVFAKIFVDPSRPNCQLCLSFFSYNNGSFEDNIFPAVIIPDGNGSVCDILDASSCLDVDGRAIIVISYLKVQIQGKYKEICAAYVNPFSNTVQTSSILSFPISQGACAPHSIVTVESTIITLLSTERLLVMTPPFGAQGQESLQLQLPKELGTPSLVSLQGNIYGTFLQGIDIFVLIHFQNSLQHNLFPIPTESNIAGDIWSVASQLHLLDSDQILSRIKNSTSSHRPASTPLQNSSRSNSPGLLTSIQLISGRISLKPFHHMDGILMHLPTTDFITHILLEEDEKSFIVASTSSLSHFTIPSIPTSNMHISSQLTSLTNVNVKGAVSAVLARSQNGSALVADLQASRTIITTPPGSSSTIIQYRMPQSGTEPLLLFHPTKDLQQTPHQWSTDAIGTWTTIDLSDFMTSSYSVLGESVCQGLQSRSTMETSKSAPISAAPLASSIDSLLNALNGRLLVSQRTVEETRHRIEVKGQLLYRAISLLSQLSNESYPNDMLSERINGAFTLSFEQEHDLVPLLGPIPGENPPARESPIHPHLVNISDIQSSFVKGKYMIQIAVRNQHPKDTIKVENVMVGWIGPLLQTSTQPISIAPGQVGIASATLFMSLESSLDPFTEVSISLEVSSSSGNFFTVPAGKLLLDPSNSGTLPFAICSHSVSLVAGSTKSSLVNAIYALLTSRVQARKITQASWQTNDGLVINVATHSNRVCLEVGSVDEEDIITLVKLLYRHLPDLNLQLNPLNQSWLHRCSQLLEALKHELHLYLTMDQVIKAQGTQKEAVETTKRRFIEAQKETDFLLGSFVK